MTGEPCIDSVVLSPARGATLGASVLVFQGIGDEAGLTFQLPLIVYLFVASMGGDYNILMIGRIREEIAAGASPREAAARALRHTGPAVMAAGVILAASFAALALNTALAQIGFAVALGIFISAFVMAGLLVPALTALMGRRAFWPARAGAPAPTATASRRRAAASPCGADDPPNGPAGHRRRARRRDTIERRSACPSPHRPSSGT